MQFFKCNSHSRGLSRDVHETLLLETETRPRPQASRPRRDRDVHQFTRDEIETETLSTRDETETETLSAAEKTKFSILTNFNCCCY